MTDNITPAELEAWRAAREKATSGEWTTEIDDPCLPWYVFADGDLTATALMYADAAFIVLAANNWTMMVEEIERLQAVIREYNEWLCKIAGNLPNVRQHDNTDEFMEYLGSLWDDVREWHAKQTDNL